MASRVIEDFEFVWMLRGEARLVTAEDELPLPPGRLLLVPPGVRHHFVWDPRGPSRHGYVHFDSEGTEGLEAGRVRWRRMTERDPLAGLCAYLIWLGRDQPDGWERDVRGTLRFLLSLFTSGPLPDDDVPAALPPPLPAVVRHLGREWAGLPLRRIGVAELSSAARVSPSYLNRRFQRTLGIGAAAAMEGLRLSRAETLLARTDLTIGAIARQCGFADLYHFSHRFRRRYGMSPSAFRAAGSPAFSVLDHPGVRRLAHAVWD